MNCTQEQLTSFKAKKGFFIGIDSDGCVFDTMELKQKECFCPAFINNFELQAVARYARQAWEFVSLYSKTRGINRFPALLHTLDLLRVRKAVIQRNVHVMHLPELEKWVGKETRLGMETLTTYLEKNNTPEIRRVHNWSADINKAVEYIVRGVSPFPWVKETLAAMQAEADSMVISQTPVSHLENEWEEHGIREYVSLIAGQDMGTKTEHITLAAVGKYPSDKILMIGDAPGDMEAALKNDALFFPICPGSEEISWKQLLDEGLDRFFSGTFKGVYQKKLIDQFNRILPENPDWN
ncbi:MAG: HAD family hydrolase [Spirochaetales bacterium]|nr:HAD family hydrolase [Spirochaetales bacterium]